ncbi:GrpB family protein [Amycolatopsis sp. TRM77291]
MSSRPSSTSVPGLAAKPVIDLMAAAEDLGAVERHEDALAEHGYRRHHNAMTDRLLYVVTKDSWPTRRATPHSTGRSWPPESAPTGTPRAGRPGPRALGLLSNPVWER